jgi:ABC-type transport system involved in multi-copper enzyme maturation permease subunit
MSKISKSGVLILAIITGILLYLNSTEDENFSGLGLFLTLLLLLLGLITSITIIICDIIKIKATKSILSFIPTITGLIIICGFNYMLNQMNKPSNIPILIQAGYSPSVAGSSLILRTDSSYDFFNGAMLSSHTTHGRFTTKDSFVFLYGKNVDKALISKHLLITSSKIIYQVDSNGKRIENSIPFSIHIDNRSK